MTNDHHECDEEIERLMRNLRREEAFHDELYAKNKMLREAVAVLFKILGGHHHWDAAGTNEANCPTCQLQREAMIRASELVEEARI